MAKCRILIKLDQARLYKMLENAVEAFKEMEAQSLNNVDIEKCIQDYSKALCSYNQTLFTTEFI